MSVETAIAVVGTVMGAKAAIDGIKEGNLLKAVVGGVGAYFGATSLAGGATTANVGTQSAGRAAQSTATAGASQIDILKAAAQSSGKMSAMNGATQAMSTATNGAANSVLSSGASVSNMSSAFNPAIASNTTLANAATNVYNPATQSFGAGGLLQPTSAIADGASFVDKLKTYGSNIQDWAKENPMLSSSALQMGGGLLQGMSQEEMMEEKWKREDEARERRGAAYTPARRSTFNPNTRRFA